MTIRLLCFKTVTVSKGIGMFHAFCGLLCPVFGTVCRIASFRGVCLRLSPIAVDKFVVKMAEAASGAGRMGDACFCGSVFSGGVLFTEKKAAVIFVREVKPAGIAVRTMRLAGFGGRGLSGSSGDFAGWRKPCPVQAILFSHTGAGRPVSGVRFLPEPGKRQQSGNISAFVPASCRFFRSEAG